MNEIVNMPSTTYLLPNIKSNTGSHMISCGISRYTTGNHVTTCGISEIIIPLVVPLKIRLPMVQLGRNGSDSLCIGTDKQRSAKSLLFARKK